MTNAQMNRFASNPVNIDIQRSRFVRPHNHSFTCNVGEVIPFYWSEILPGDSVSVDTAKVIRMQPMVCPVFGNLFCDVYWFFIPNRLVWDHWREFMGENTQTAWTPPVEYNVPQLLFSVNKNVKSGSIADHMGLPLFIHASNSVSVLPLRAYALTMNEWFRSTALQDPVHVFKDDVNRYVSQGSNQVTDIELGGMPFIAAKFHDYFSAALPQPQFGPSVSFALAGSAPVIASPSASNYVGKPVSSSDRGAVKLARPDNPNYVAESDLRNVITSPDYLQAGQTFTPPISGGHDIVFDNLIADMSNVSQFSINELRMAFSIQRFYEKLARGGDRYISQIKSFFGVTSPDARMQRPEYLGGNRFPINITDVAQTSATEQGVSPQGNLAAISHTGDLHSDFTHSFTEHGILLGVMCIRYHHVYQQGINRQWLRKTRFDYYNPTFANIGEQQIKDCEIYAKGIDSANSVFGYQEAWSEYRYHPDLISGELRSDCSTPLDMWHYADKYNSKPFLSDSWIREDKANVDRSLAVQSSVQNQIFCDFHVDAVYARPMPMYSIPGLIDHH